MSSRLISRAESWETVYTAFQTINFTAFDFDAVKESLVDYVKLYHPESFNDMIESSEFIAIVELFAYVAELLSYRIDVTAHENFISTAQRKDSVLRLAKMISYHSSRNMPARGMVKITSVSTTEHLYDSDGTDLINKVIRWNDPNNSKWKQQSFLVFNRILTQEFGTVSPNDRIQVGDALFELYEIKNIPSYTQHGVFKYNASVSGTSVPMELVPSTLTENGPEERRPEDNLPFSLMYVSDGLGDSSDTTGFFIFTKQGSLQRLALDFDGTTPNQNIDLSPQNINEIDVWLNNVNADTGETLNDGSVPNGISGHWYSVDTTNAQNVIFNSLENRNKYEIETLDNDQIRLIFGDGEFATIPSGTFHAWVRTSINDSIIIPQTSIINKTASFQYFDTQGNLQTFTITFSLTESLLNSSSSEDIEHIRKNAPAVYYTQNRMVTAQDYNTFLLRDPNLLKIRSINRTFSGDSKYVKWNDASATYDNVKIFGDDLAVFFKNSHISFEVSGNITAPVLLTDYIQPLISTTDVFLFMSLLDDYDLHKVFSALEQAELLNVIGNVAFLSDGSNTFLNHEYSGGTWWHPSVTEKHTTVFRVQRVGGKWLISYNIKRMLVESDNTLFWNTNDGSTVVDYDTLGASNDKLVLLKANENKNRSGLLPENVSFNIIGSEIIDDLESPDKGLPNLHMLNILPEDKTGDLVPEDVALVNLLDRQVTTTVSTGLAYLPSELTYIVGFKDITNVDGVYTILSVDELLGRVTVQGTNFLSVMGPTITIEDSRYNDGVWTVTGTPAIVSGNTVFDVTGNIKSAPSLGVVTLVLNAGSDWREDLSGGTLGGTSNVISILKSNIMSVRITLKDFVYFNRLSHIDPWVVVEITNTTKDDFVADNSTLTSYSVNNTTTSGDTIKLSNPGDFTDIFVAGQVLEIQQSVANNGLYAVLYSSTFVVGSSTYTQIKIHSLLPANPLPSNPAETVSISSVASDGIISGDTFKRERGRSGFNFLWLHYTTSHNLVDPSPSNIIDTYVVPRNYYTYVRSWLDGNVAFEPKAPTPLQLRTDYGYLLESKMISDTVVLHPGKFKYLFGDRASPELQAKFKIITTPYKTKTDNQIKVSVVSLIKQFFDVTKWEFGETFYFTELAAYIHQSMPSEISSIVLVPTYSKNLFGDLFQVYGREDELFLPSISVTNLEMVDSYNAVNLKQFK